jgi:hypothetical protein
MVFTCLFAPPGGGARPRQQVKQVTYHAVWCCVITSKRHCWRNKHLCKSLNTCHHLPNDRSAQHGDTNCDTRVARGAARRQNLLGCRPMHQLECIAARNFNKFEISLQKACWCMLLQELNAQNMMLLQKHCKFSTGSQLIFWIRLPW